MYGTHICAEIHIINWGWHLETLTKITNLTRSKQSKQTSFNLCEKGDKHLPKFLQLFPFLFTFCWNLVRFDIFVIFSKSHPWLTMGIWAQLWVKYISFQGILANFKEFWDRVSNFKYMYKRLKQNTTITSTLMASCVYVVFLSHCSNDVIDSDVRCVASLSWHHSHKFPKQYNIQYNKQWHANKSIFWELRFAPK